MCVCFYGGGMQVVDGRAKVSRPDFYRFFQSVQKREPPRKYGAWLTALVYEAGIDVQDLIDEVPFLKSLSP